MEEILWSGLLNRDQHRENRQGARGIMFACSALAMDRILLHVKNFIIDDV